MPLDSMVRKANKRGRLFMITYLKMKHLEWKLKLTFYRFLMPLQTLISRHGEDTMKLVERSILVLKDVPPEELYENLISEIAKVVHETSNKNGD